MCLKNDLTLGQTGVEKGIYQFSYTNEFIPSREENWRIPSFNAMDVSIWQSGSKIWKKRMSHFHFHHLGIILHPNSTHFSKFKLKKTPRKKMSTYEKFFNEVYTIKCHILF